MTNKELAAAYVLSQRSGFAAMQAKRLTERQVRDAAQAKHFEAFVTEQEAYILEHGTLKPFDLIETVPSNVMKPTQPQDLPGILKALFGGIPKPLADAEAAKADSDYAALKAELNGLDSTGSDILDPNAPADSGNASASDPL